MSKPRVYFYCRDDVGNLQEDVVALAEGFLALGVPFSGSSNYWLRSTRPNDYLIRYNPDITPDDCDVVVVSYTWSSWMRGRTFDVLRRPLPENLFKQRRRYLTVCMDNHDGHRSVSWEPEFRQFDAIFRSHMNRRAWHPENLRPWVLGLNNRIIEATPDGVLFAKRRQCILVNFGASHPYSHGTRDLASARFGTKISRLLEIDITRDDLSNPPVDPFDVLLWQQTGGRFSRQYYQRLGQSQAVACFCGEMIPPMPFRNPECYLVGGNRAKIRRGVYELLGRFDSRPPRSIQWDSFRFWETLAAGAVAFNLDLEHYGVEIPVMPVNWTHYVGVNLGRVDDTIERLEGEPKALERIGRAGRLWALEHYAPRPMAERFLRALDMWPSGPTTQCESPVATKVPEVRGVL
ncbi:MAG: glycosyltransferase family 1 protein [Acidobacteriota bacterium]